MLSKLENATYSTPNRIVWEYFLSLRLIEKSARDAPSPVLAMQQAALAIIMCVAVVDVFLNMWFRVKVEEMTDKECLKSFQKDIDKRISLGDKLKKWPERYLIKPLNLDVGPGKNFSEIKQLRNSIIHFTSNHESLKLTEEVIIHGLADTTNYDSLNASNATYALKTAEELVLEIFSLANLDPEQTSSVMHAWTGNMNYYKAD